MRPNRLERLDGMNVCSLKVYDHELASVGRGPKFVQFGAAGYGQLNINESPSIGGDMVAAFSEIDKSIYPLHSSSQWIELSSF